MEYCTQKTLPYNSRWVLCEGAPWRDPATGQEGGAPAKFGVALHVTRDHNGRVERVMHAYLVPDPEQPGGGALYRQLLAEQRAYVDIWRRIDAGEPDVSLIGSWDAAVAEQVAALDREVPV